MKQLIALQNVSQRDSPTKANAKALTDKLTPVVALQKNQLVSQHSYNDITTVAFVADSTASAA